MKILEVDSSNMELNECDWLEEVLLLSTQYNQDSHLCSRQKKNLIYRTFCFLKGFFQCSSSCSGHRSCYANNLTGAH